ncbi:MAG TPA: hypothetical protein VMV50_00855 [Candidatus Paceibacterota bacterium]|nr:hypothetical protein [Candidatus Paceibacterota bacterium]
MKSKMKFLVAFCAAAALGAFGTGTAFADGTANAASGANSASNAASQAGSAAFSGSNVGVKVSTSSPVSINYPAQPNDITVKSVPETVAPALTTTLTETCMGSSSGSISGVAVGFSLGSTWTDEHCVHRLDARQLAALGYKEAARALMCENSDVQVAFSYTSDPCPQTAAKGKQASAQSTSKVSSAEGPVKSGTGATVALVGDGPILSATPVLEYTDSNGVMYRRANESSPWVAVKN